MGERVFKRAYLGDGYTDEAYNETFKVWMRFRPLIGRERAVYAEEAKGMKLPELFDLNTAAIVGCVLEWQWPTEEFEEALPRSVDNGTAAGLHHMMRPWVLSKIMMRPMREDVEQEQTNLGNSEAGRGSSSSTRNSRPATADSAGDSNSTKPQDKSDEDETENPYRGLMA